jgi:chromosome segregation ATPase
MQRILIAGFLVWLCVAAPTRAQVERSGGGGASQKILQQYQQLAAEKTALQAQVEQLKKDLDGAHAELAAVKKERDALKGHSGGSAAAMAQAQSAIAQARSGKEASDRALEQSKQRMAELVSKFRETAQNLKDVESDRTQQRAELGRRNQAFDTCAQDNMALYDIARDVLYRYENTSAFTRISASEPFTKITRTRIENLVTEYRARAAELQIKRRTP